MKFIVNKINTERVIAFCMCAAGAAMLIAFAVYIIHHPNLF